MAGKKIQITLNDETQSDLEVLKSWSGLKTSAVISVALRVLHRNIERDKMDDSFIRDLFGSKGAQK